MQVTIQYSLINKYLRLIKGPYGSQTAYRIGEMSHPRGTARMIQLLQVPNAWAESRREERKHRNAQHYCDKIPWKH